MTFENMKREDAFDIILKFLYENSKNYWVLIPTCREKLNIKDGALISSIAEEMINRKWANPKNDDKLSVALSYDGRVMIEKYGSYSSFLRSEKATQSKEHRSKLIPDIIKIGIAIIFGLSTAILGWLNYTDNQKIEIQQTEIKALNKRIDSLQTELKKRHTTPTIIQSGDSIKK